MITNIGNVSPEIPGGNHATCTVAKSSRSSQSVLFIDVDDRTLNARAYDQNMAELDSFSIVK